MKSVLKAIAYRLFPMLHVINQPKSTFVQKHGAHIEDLIETIERRGSGLDFVGKDRRQEEVVAAEQKQKKYG
jgi:hypothetical protein